MFGVNLAQFMTHLRNKCCYSKSIRPFRTTVDRGLSIARFALTVLRRTRGGSSAEERVCVRKFRGEGSITKERLDEREKV